MMLSFVEAFWVMGIVFFCMVPLLLLLRDPRKLHPHEPKPPRRVAIEEPSHEPEPELIGAH